MAGFVQGDHRSDYIDLVYSGRRAKRSGDLVMDSDFAGCIEVSYVYTLNSFQLDVGTSSSFKLISHVN